MPDNCALWLRKNKSLIGKRILEVGSRSYRGSPLDSIRPKHRKRSEVYIGADIADGDNVDVIVDITGNPGEVQRALGGEAQYDTIFCLSVLEHIPNVFGAAWNIESLLRPSGRLFVSVPFVFRFHGYPGDYWRFTPEAVMHLFPGISFGTEPPQAMMTTMEPDGLHPIHHLLQKRNRILYRPDSLDMKNARKQQKKAQESGEEGNGTVAPYYLAPCMINMVGVRRD